MNIPDAEWEEIYGRLYAFTLYLLNQYTWFRKGDGDTFLKGKSADDYVYEAVTRHLQNPHKYNGNKRGLVGYLKKHIILTLVGNDARSLENRLSHDIWSRGQNEDGDESFHSIDRFLPCVRPLFDENIDYKAIITEIRGELQRDKDAAIIFDFVLIGDQTRGQVIKNQGWTPNIFDNAMKRLKRVLNNVAKKYQLTKNQ